MKHSDFDVTNQSQNFNCEIIGKPAFIRLCLSDIKAHKEHNSHCVLRSISHNTYYCIILQKNN